MIVRVRIHPGKEDEFERFVTETGIPTVKAQPGCSHVTAGQSRWSEQPEFVVVTHWSSGEALQSFAGPDWQTAVIAPEEEHMLARSSAIIMRRSTRAEPIASPSNASAHDRLTPVSVADPVVGRDHELALAREFESTAWATVRGRS